MKFGVFAIALGVFGFESVRAQNVRQQQQAASSQNQQNSRAPRRSLQPRRISSSTPGRLGGTRDGSSTVINSFGSVPINNRPVSNLQTQLAALSPMMQFLSQINPNNTGMDQEGLAAEALSGNSEDPIKEGRLNVIKGAGNTQSNGSFNQIFGD